MPMIEVSKERFFESLGRLNVHPRPERSFTEWAMLSTRQVVGRSEPGYVPDYQKPTRYWIDSQYSENHKPA